ncbi:CTD kinase subunit alpha [[Candida] anglica]|uniref:CTD kinase subunit alpha n=1 Tax=[Candida] anglica TaxID=148631 RepID=A0ABP0ECN6_9ASCO
MSDRYRPSGGANRGRPRGGGQYRSQFGPGGNNQSGSGNGGSTGGRSSRDYYSEPKRYGQENSRDIYRPGGPSGTSQRGAAPTRPSGNGPPTGPSGARALPTGPSGYRSTPNQKPQHSEGGDTYRPSHPSKIQPSQGGRSSRPSLPPQQSTIQNGKRPLPHEPKFVDGPGGHGGPSGADDDSYYKRQDRHGGDYGHQSQYRDTRPIRGQRGGARGGGAAIRGRGGSMRGGRGGGRGGASVGDSRVPNNKPNGPHPSTHKKVRKDLKKSQIYSMKVTKPFEIYARVQQVGEGTYGKVYKAKNSITNEFVALKKLRLETEREGFPITALREIKLLQSFNHVNVVGLLEMMVESNQIYMIFDYMDHDLTGLLTHVDVQLEECHKKFIFKQLMEGLNYLHRKRVIHRDIKGSNILLNNIGVVKIADFGLARTMKSVLNGESPDYTNRVITIWYRPPELLLGSTDYGREVDIWGVGCLLIELYSRSAIFQGFDEVGQLQKIFNIMGTPTIKDWPRMDDLPWFEMLKPKINKASIFERDYRPLMSELSFDLAKNLLMLDPSRRFNAEKALEHPYFYMDPKPEPLYFLKEMKGEWHEFETKKRRRKERKRIQEAKEKEEKDSRTSAPATGRPVTDSIPVTENLE